MAGVAHTDCVGRPLSSLLLSVGRQNEDPMKIARKSADALA